MCSQEQQEWEKKKATDEEEVRGREYGPRRKTRHLRRVYAQASTREALQTLGCHVSHQPLFLPQGLLRGGIRIPPQPGRDQGLTSMETAHFAYSKDQGPTFLLLGTEDRS